MVLRKVGMRRHKSLEAVSTLIVELLDERIDVFVDLLGALHGGVLDAHDVEAYTEEDELVIDESHILLVAKTSTGDGELLYHMMKVLLRNRKSNTIFLRPILKLNHRTRCIFDLD